MTNITHLRTFFTVLTICLFLNSCAFLGIPWQLSAATTAGDILSIDKTGKSVSENVASIAVSRDCQWSRIFLGWPPCLTQEERISYLMRMNCKTYSWNFLNNLPKGVGVQRGAMPQLVNNA